MIARHGNQFVAYCDFCSSGECETGEPDFRDAVITMQAQGWKVFRERGEWNHKCADCVKGNAEEMFDVL